MSHSTITGDPAADRHSPAAESEVASPSSAGSSLSGGWGDRARRALPRILPTTAVIAALVGIAVWGHSSDWTLPKFSALVGGEQDPDAAWCPTHNVAEAECIECNVSLVPLGKDYGWCQEHGIAQCVLEHPDVAQLKTTPVVTDADLQRARRALELRPRPENNSLCSSRQRRIQFASIAALEKAGVDIAVVGRRRVVEALTANGEVNYDETRTAHLVSRAEGAVWRVDKQVGDPVRKGDVLALVDAADVGKAKSEFLQAIAQLRLREVNVERLNKLAGDGAVAGRALREAEALLQEAQIRLLGAQQALVNLGLTTTADRTQLADSYAGETTDEIGKRIQLLGLPNEVIATLDDSQVSSNLLPLLAPLDGIVVRRDVVPGEVVDTTTMLFEVADVRQMWLILDLRQEDARYVALGQRVLFRSSDSRDEAEIEGTVLWISTSADSQTRTVKVRVDLPNPDGRLRANTFGTGRIILRDEPEAIVVPNEAVHFDGDCSFVFVRDKNFLNEGAPKFFHTRQVRVGVKDAGGTEIIAGLLPGEVIAQKNSVVLAAQLLKSNLGAGCGCVDGHQ